MRTPPTVLPPPPSPSSSSAARAAIVVSAAATHIIHLSPPLTSSTTTPTTTSNEPPHQIRWRHYSGTKEFEANAALVLIILLCALICALALNASIRCFLRGGGSGGGSSGVSGRGGNNSGQVHYQHPRSIIELVEHQQKTNGGGGAPLESAPALVYSAGMKTKLAGVEAECVICLSEFVEGEEIRVLGWCKHGFHSQCIQEWFSSHSSCPTCRRSFRPPSPSRSSAVPERAPVGEFLTGV
ncbi:RING-H2 finger protein ATL79 [Ziziphus jujuba]|uniref:RING-type E3 ubiquitin transferase n=1 Tax=Ziziphus jujuba TaxID=326968 RepID=A0A6P4BQS2_ZIZJJ|nr:RING-H2 finger protein ATL79 [Ziziphus jujuba]